MDVVALVLAGLSLLVAVLALFSSHSRANESNRLAREALAEARSSKVGDIWAAVIRSVNHRMTFNPTAEDAGPMLRDARADLMALVDALPEWGALGEWAAHEQALGALAAHADLEDMTSDPQRLPEHSARWGAAFVINLRRFRATGYDEQMMRRLTDNAREQSRHVCAARGWELPPEAMPGIALLDETPEKP
ncbi:hypothetical protein [Janibacter limosus]|jgi:hypothetical protein|uniref:Uncharacterized protein n=1 Tax=Janibacter limosus TaxID=53458 RepID=A0A4P6MVV3_9MICO|nr:hypothetical protein [Janibacter limosus]QBF45710.1 hypothetical protein EXU32_05205 [Janibacter limosus]